jgi:hypothetical protein
MVTNFIRKKPLSTPESHSVFPQKITELFHSLDLFNWQSESEIRQQRMSLFDKRWEWDNSQFYKNCCIFILIDQILAKGEKCRDPKVSFRMAVTAKSLLQTYDKCQILITTPEKINPDQYIEEVITKAEEVVKNTVNFSEDLRNTATELQKRNHELLDFFKCERFPTYNITCLQNFLSSWQDFARQFLTERVQSFL